MGINLAAIKNRVENGVKNNTRLNGNRMSVGNFSADLANKGGFDKIEQAIEQQAQNRNTPTQDVERD